MANKILYSTINYPQEVKVVFAKINNVNELTNAFGDKTAEVFAWLGDVIREKSLVECVPMRIKLDDEPLLVFDCFEQDDYKQVYAVYRFEEF